MKPRTWKSSKDPLFRGDDESSIRAPTPDADDSIVRHILYLEGPGRESPYLSTSENEDVARYFAGKGSVWQTMVKLAKDAGVKHISKTELLHVLKGNGKGQAKWGDPFEVMQARRYVEEWGEHLLDFREIDDAEQSVKATFRKR